MSSRLFLAALSLTGLLAGCANPSDLGTPCFLVKKDPATSATVRLKEREITADRDFISFGASECENYVCVRDAQFVPDGAVTPDSDAIGYCSVGCEPGADSTLNNQCASADSADDQDEARRLTCRSMLLDTETINLICAADPAQCQRIFGDTRTPYFCARG